MLRVPNKGEFLSRHAKNLFGDNLKRLRYIKNWTQADVAKKCHVSTPTISQWEKGEYLPDGDKIDLICGLFEVSPQEMFAADATDAKNAMPLTVRQAFEIVNNYPNGITIKPRTLVKKS